MSTHQFPVRSSVRPAQGLASIHYPPPFASEQNEEYKVKLEGCPCLGGLAGNWYFYPEDKRQMYGLGVLNNTLFTVPGIGYPITVKRALVGVGGILLVGWLLKH